MPALQERAPAEQDTFLVEAAARVEALQATAEQTSPLDGRIHSAQSHGASGLQNTNGHVPETDPIMAAAAKVESLQPDHNQTAATGAELGEVVHADAVIDTNGDVIPLSRPTPQDLRDAAQGTRRDSRSSGADFTGNMADDFRSGAIGRKNEPTDGDRRIDAQDERAKRRAAGASQTAPSDLGDHEAVMAGARQSVLDRKHQTGTGANERESVSSPLYLESAHASENSEGIQVVDNEEVGIFAIIEASPHQDGGYSRDASRTATSFNHLMRATKKPTTVEEAGVRMRDVAAQAGLGSESAARGILTSVEEIDGKQYLVWANNSAGHIVVENEDGEIEHLEDNLGVREIKEDDCVSLCTAGIVGAAENEMSDQDIAQAFDGESAQEVADNLLASAKGTGLKAVVTIDAYDKEHEDSLDAEDLDEDMPEDMPSALEDSVEEAEKKGIFKRIGGRIAKFKQWTIGKHSAYASGQWKIEDAQKERVQNRKRVAVFAMGAFAVVAGGYVALRSGINPLDGQEAVNNAPQLDSSISDTLSDIAERTGETAADAVEPKGWEGVAQSGDSITSVLMDHFEGMDKDQAWELFSKAKEAGVWETVEGVVPLDGVQGGYGLVEGSHFEITPEQIDQLKELNKS